MLIPTAKNVKNITDFRKDPDSVLESIQGKSDPLYLFRGSEPKAVVLDIEEYARLMETEEDYHDLLLISEIAADPHRHEGLTIEEVIKKYNINVDAESNSSRKSSKKISKITKSRPSIWKFKRSALSIFGR